MRTLQDQELDRHGGGYGFIGAGIGAVTGAVGSVYGQYSQTGTVHPAKVIMSTGLGAVSGFSGGLATTLLRNGRWLGGTAAAIYSIGTGAGNGAINGLGSSHPSTPSGGGSE